MSEPRADRDFDQSLAAWMGDVAPDRPPSRLLEETFARTMKARQARTNPWFRIGVGALGRPQPRSGLRSGILVLAVLVVAALGVVLVAGGLRLVPPPSQSPTPTSGPVQPSSPASASLPAPILVTPEAVITVDRPLGLVQLGTAIWVLTTGALVRIDPATNTVTGTVAIGGAADLYNDLAANEAGLWATDWDTAELVRVDPDALQVVARIPAGLGPKGILATADGVWVADTHDGKVLRVDPATNTVVARITVGPSGNSGPNWLAIGLGSIWVNIPNNSTVVRIDPVTNAIQATIPIAPPVVPCGGFDFEPTVVWVTSCGGGSRMAGVDPATNTVTGTRDLGTGRGNPFMINGAAWFNVDTGDTASGMLQRIDAATNSVDRVLIPGEGFRGGGNMLVSAGSLWLVDDRNSAVLRLPLAAFGP